MKLRTKGSHDRRLQKLSLKFLNKLRVTCEALGREVENYRGSASESKTFRDR